MATCILCGSLSLGKWIGGVWNGSSLASCLVVIDRYSQRVLKALVTLAVVERDILAHYVRSNRARSGD
jgi:hypothetical protein